MQPGLLDPRRDLLESDRIWENQVSLRHCGAGRHGPRVYQLYLGKSRNAIWRKRSSGSAVQLGRPGEVFVSVDPPVLGEGRHRHEGHCGVGQPLEAS